MTPRRSLWSTPARGRPGATSSRGSLTRPSPTQTGQDVWKVCHYKCLLPVCMKTATCFIVSPSVPEAPGDTAGGRGCLRPADPGGRAPGGVRGGADRPHPQVPLLHAALRGVHRVRPAEGRQGDQSEHVFPARDRILICDWSARSCAPGQRTRWSSSTRTASPGTTGEL